MWRTGYNIEKAWFQSTERKLQRVRRQVYSENQAKDSTGKGQAKKWMKDRGVSSSGEHKDAEMS